MPLFGEQLAKVLSITELTAALKTTLEEGFPSVWVSGEISTLSRPASGHAYLMLKDSTSQLGAIIWRSLVSKLQFEPKVGMEVIARGGINLYAPRGEYRLHIDEMHPKGLGARERALRELKEKLQKLGYFDPKRKKPLPRFPRCIGLITSATGAAIRDLLEILSRRWPVADIWICAVKVQGQGAAQEVASALQTFNRLETPDVIIVGRGGGSVDDLWAFNEEEVAVAIHQSRIPVISAVGHEIDVTIADLVADFRAATPSEAAERATPDRIALLKGLNELAALFRTRIVRIAELHKRRLHDLSLRRVFRQPLERIRDGERLLDDRVDRLQRQMHARMARLREQLAATSARLDTLSPLNVLGRGYSLTRRADNLGIVRQADQLREGDLLLTRFQSGQIYSRVETGQAPPAGQKPSSTTEATS